MNKDIFVRPAVMADLPAAAQLYDELTDSLAAGRNWPGWKKGIYPAWEDAEAAIQAGTLYLAVDASGRLAGSVNLSHQCEPGYETIAWQIDASCNELLVVHTLAVHPAFARRGVGRALMEFAEQLGRSRGIKALRLDVTDGNDPAIRLYERCGFVPLGRFDQGLGAQGLDWFLAYEKVL